jgi:hypothetical protein
MDLAVAMTRWLLASMMAASVYVPPVSTPIRYCGAGDGVAVGCMTGAKLRIVGAALGVMVSPV